MERAKLAAGVVAGALAPIQVAYWAAVAFIVDRHASGGCGYWSSGGAGRLIPWPEPPGLLGVITEMNPLDTAACVAYRTGLFVPAIIVVSIGLFVLGLILFRWRDRRQGLTKVPPSR